MAMLTRLVQVNNRYARASLGAVVAAAKSSR
jgi:hypothetical protein